MVHAPNSLALFLKTRSLSTCLQLRIQPFYCDTPPSRRRKLPCLDDSVPPFHPYLTTTLPYLHHHHSPNTGSINSPQLRTPPPLTQQGTQVEPVPEKSFIQKYWVYILVAVAALGRSIGDTPSGVFCDLTASLSFPFQSFRRAHQRRKEVHDKVAAKSNSRYMIFVSLISLIGGHLHRRNLPIHGDVTRVCATDQTRRLSRPF